MSRLVLIVLAAFLFSTGRSNNTVSYTSGLLENQSIDIEGNKRQYHLYIPPNPVNAPVVFILHGNGGSNDQVIGLEGTNAPHKLWLNIAERDNLILVVPNGTIGGNGRRGWNDCRIEVEGNPTVDDVTFLSTLIDHIQSTYQTQSKVFSVGTSNGAFMTQRLADEIPEKVAAIGVVVASRPAGSKCPESTVAVPIVIINGTDDPLVPYEGGQVASDRGEILSTDKTIGYWTNRNQTDSNPTVTEISNINVWDRSTITKYSYSNGLNDSEVVLYKVNGGGHTEPSITERYSSIFKLIVGSQNGDIETAEEVWAFFARNIN